MAATGAGVNVLRWGALVFGVFYGFSHQSSIRAQDLKAAAQHEWDRKEKLIHDAKAAYAKKTQPQTQTTGSNIISNPDDPNFDLEALLNKVQAEKL